ncbi:MAG TPA: outer membrane lipoprotein carrier protein LolA [Pyrinomonadaceae bacterium]|nr:outer membrane lipoprotein carrier protein LolA [Pyrinomonadaceae bacterium]
MKKLLTLSLAALMLVASLAFVAQPAQAQGAGLVSSILNKMDRNRRDLSSLRAALTMQKYNSQLRDTETTYGEMAYIAAKGKDANVRVDWVKPVRESLSVMNGEYTLYRPRLGQAIKGSARGGDKKTKVNSVLNFAFSMTGAQAKSQFNVSYEGEGELYPGSPHVLWLKLTPRGGASYKEAEVWVTDDGMPIQARVTEKNNDATTVRLTNVQRNARVAPSDIEIPLPAGTKIVRG